MALILNIETATRNCSVALADGGRVIAARDFAADGYSHAEKLHVFINEVLAEKDLEPSSLDAIAVGKGPGSYTGLRIGVSTAKGLAYGLGIPLISADTLEVLARQINVDEGFIVPMIDARRMEVYSAIFDTNFSGIEPTRAEIITSDSYAHFTETLHFVGDCQEKVREVVKDPNKVFHENAVFPSSKEMAVISEAKFQRGEFEDVAYFEPFYLKDFIVGAKN